MNDGSVEIFELINLYLPKEYELNLAYDNGIIKEWHSENHEFKMTRDIYNNYSLVNKKRIVSFTAELIIGTDCQHEIIISMLTDICIDVLALNLVDIKLYNQHPIYILNKRKSYGGITALEYTHSKDMILNNHPNLMHCLGLAYENQVKKLCIRV